MKISYCITACTEYKELHRLVDLLLDLRDLDDQIIIQTDSELTTPEVCDLAGSYAEFRTNVKHISFPLSGDFAAYKNNLFNYAEGSWCFFIDADEFPHENLIKNLHAIVADCATNGIETVLVPRINTVEGINEDWIKEWGWRMNTNGWVNFPDFQYRLVLNKPRIRWENRVHEVIKGYQAFALLPQEEEWCLYHPKDIDRQIRQNEKYLKM